MLPLNRFLIPSGATRKIVTTGAFAAIASVALTGCVGILPNSNTEAGREKLNEVHSVEYTVEAPFGSTVTYSDGTNTMTAKTDNTGSWTETLDVQGITSVTVSVVSADGDATATCDITVDGSKVATGMSAVGVTEEAMCKASTSKT